MKTMHRVNALFLCFLALLYVLSTIHQVVAQSFLVTQLSPNDSTGGFGVSSAISGATIVIGARSDGYRGPEAGAAYIFVRTGSGWAQQAKLTASDGAAGDIFGESVGISADTVVVGAPGSAPGSGSAYVFVRIGGSWVQQAKLTASDGAPNDGFGGAVAINGDTVVIGAPENDSLAPNAGAAYVFVRAGGIWAQQAKLIGTWASFGNFGEAVSISGNTVVVGAYLEAAPFTASGAAYVFVRAGGVWSQQAKLTPSDIALGDQFGEGVAVSGDTVIVGAPRDDDGGDATGSAYVFARVGTSWIQEAKLIASDPAEDRRFGATVAADGNTLVVEAIRNGGGTYLFVRSAGTWVEQIKLPNGSTPGTPTPNRVSVSGNRITSSNYVFESANQSPVANAGPDQTVECTSSSGAHVTLNGSTSSDPNGDSLTYEWREGSTLLGMGATLNVGLPLGSHTITLTVIDPNGASSQDTVIANVVDTTRPTISVPPNVTVMTGPGSTECGKVVNDATLGTATASDTCGGATITRTGVPAGNFFPVSTTTITYMATDPSGNTATATQTVTVIDNTPPVITNPSANPPVLWPPNQKMVNITVNYGVTDNCDTASAITCTLNVSSNEPINGTGDGDTTPHWEIIDAHHVRLRAERAGNGTGRIYTITIICHDSAGDSSSKNVTVQVPKSQGQN